jgi:hypothetical protein
MISKLVLALGGVHSELNWWSCPPVDEMEDFDPKKFSGLWYEQYRDAGHAFWSNQRCVQDHYTVTSRGLKLDRSFQTKWFGWNFNQRNMKITSPRSSFDGFANIRKGLFKHNQHYVVDTDYDNYAIVYGCEPVFFFFAHYRYATLLSRDKFLDFPYVRKAKNFLNDIDYNYGTLWTQNGEECGIDAAPTMDEVMLAIFEHQPKWSDYKPNLANTKLAKLMYEG